MGIRLLALIAVTALLVAMGLACGAPATATHTPSPTSTNAPTLAPTPGVSLSTIGSSAAAGQDTTQPRTISVTGSANVMVVPDEVALTVGVENSDLVLTKAKNDNDAIIKRVLAEVQNLGVEERYIQTDYISIEPRYQDAYLKDASQKRELIGYFVRKNIAFTLKDVSRFEDLYSTILESGVTHVYGIEFRTTELRKYRDQARVLAIQAARGKAEALAKE
ncbi:MAG: SIMPL domain-containing protein, partial [Chloroflexota bacterium]